MAKGFITRRGSGNGSNSSFKSSAIANKSAIDTSGGSVSYDGNFFYQARYSTPSSGIIKTDSYGNIVDTIIPFPSGATHDNTTFSKYGIVTWTYGSTTTVDMYDVEGNFVRTLSLDINSNSSSTYALVVFALKDKLCVIRSGSSMYVWFVNFDGTFRDGSPFLRSNAYSNKLNVCLMNQYDNILTLQNSSTIMSQSGPSYTFFIDTNAEVVSTQYNITSTFFQTVISYT